jgi:hypothetical protein
MHDGLLPDGVVTAGTARKFIQAELMACCVGYLVSRHLIEPTFEQRNFE